MRTALRRFLNLTMLGVVATALAAGTAAAKNVAPGSLDTSKQIAKLQKGMETLAGKGGVAQPGLLSTLADCGYGASSEAFLPWGDLASYSLAPDGDLATTDDWTLTNVSVDPAHDPYSAAVGSLVLASNGSTAESPAACVNTGNPTLRFFLNHSGPRQDSSLDVYIVYEGLDGKSHTLTLASLTVGDFWQPSLTIPIGVNLLSAASVSGWTPVSFGFTTHGLVPGESYSVDGIYVDPLPSP
jgi:hypothetical protein